MLRVNARAVVADGQDALAVRDAALNPDGRLLAGGEGF